MQRKFTIEITALPVTMATHGCDVIANLLNRHAISVKLGGYNLKMLFLFNKSRSADSLIYLLF